VIARGAFIDDGTVCEPDTPVLQAAAKQLAAYFAGELTAFDLPLRPVGTDFQQRVWALLRTIPYGGSISYGQIAALLGKPGAARAAGNACGANPLPLLIPCHRVLGTGGRLGGFSCGIWRKKFLLALEGHTI
jgi:methylated-DNA-[protein]-cysteine S-methyltransferase